MSGVNIQTTPIRTVYAGEVDSRFASFVLLHRYGKACCIREKAAFFNDRATADAAQALAQSTVRDPDNEIYEVIPAT